MVRHRDTVILFWTMNEWQNIKLCWNQNRTFRYHAHYCAR